MNMKNRLEKIKELEREIESDKSSLKEYEDFYNKNIEQCQKEIEELKKNKRVKPFDGTSIFHVSHYGTIGFTIWDNSCVLCQYLYLTNNWFLTEQEAEFEQQRRLVLAELRNFAEENNDCEIDWKDGKRGKYYIYYDHNVNEFEWHATYTDSDIENVYFTSQKLTDQAIQVYGDRLKKYVFEVE